MRTLLALLLLCLPASARDWICTVPPACFPVWGTSVQHLGTATMLTVTCKGWSAEGKAIESIWKKLPVGDGTVLLKPAAQNIYPLRLTCT